MTVLAQMWFNASLAFPQHFKGPARKIALVLSSVFLRCATIIMRDPNVTYIVHGTRLILPMSHALPRILLRHPDYSSNIGRIALAISRKYRKFTMIDIGANVGDTVAMVRRYVDVQTLCVDGNQRFFQLLSANARQWQNVEMECAFVGCTSGVVAGRIQSDHGTGHLVNDVTGKIQTQTLGEIIERHPSFQNAKLVKIDTDGFDTLIIKGAINTISLLRPLLYFEYDPYFFQQHDPRGFEVFSQLRDQGYVAAIFYEHTGEFLTQVALKDRASLHNLHARCTGRAGGFYLDICVVHADDVNLLDEIIRCEKGR